MYVKSELKTDAGESLKILPLFYAVVLGLKKSGNKSKRFKSKIMFP